MDCGSLIGGGGPRKISEVADAIIDDVTDEDDVARIDLVIGSHRHADHVSGFENKRWHDVQVGEVWMPWTEHPTDPEATRIRETQSRVAARLTAALAASTSAEGRFAHMLAVNSLKNAKAMAMLHGGFANAPKPKFLPTKHAAYSVRKPPRLPGVRVHVWAPRATPRSSATWTRRRAAATSRSTAATGRGRRRSRRSPRRRPGTSRSASSGAGRTRSTSGSARATAPTSTSRATSTSSRSRSRSTRR